jgi:hypothetical protein
MTRESFGTQPVMTFAEIGAVMNVTKQRAEQIYWNAIKKLRRHPHHCLVLYSMQCEIDARREVATPRGHVKVSRCN